MKKNYLNFLGKRLILGTAAAFACLSVDAQSITTFTFGYTGSMQSFTIPSCVSTVTLVSKGAQGGASADAATPGGLGGQATGVLSVTPGNVLNIFVGGTNGYNGGGAAGVNSGCGSASGGVGGGASDVRLNGTTLADRILVAGGGGGGGGNRISGCGRGAGGGGGGGYYGGGGGSGYPSSSLVVPTGGTQSSGGAAGTSAFSAAQNGSVGVLGIGGAGGFETGSNQAGANSALVGGAGGGLIGGSGQQPATNIFTGQSGAGGSSYTGTLTGASTTSNVNTGNGFVSISYIYAGGVVTAAASSTLICSGSSINLSAIGSVLNYTWSTGSNNASLTVSPTTNTVYSVSSTNSINCVSTSSIAIVVNSGLPVLSVASSTNQTCLGKTVSVTATGANTYTWSNNLSNGVFFTPTSTSTYVVTGQNACGTSTSAITISVAPLPLSLVVSPTIVCSGQQATLNVSSAATSYTWLPINSSGATTSLVVSPVNNTTYTVAATDGTCSGVGTISLATKANPTVSIVSTASTVCEGAAVTMTASGGISYTWSPVSSSSSVITVNPMAPTAYSVGATNSLGCSAGAQTVVITNPSPTVSAITSDALICAGATVTLTASGANTYSWNSGATSSVVIDSPSSTTIYTVTGTTNSCSATQTVEVDVYTPSVAISGNTVLCAGQTTTLMASGATNYTWEPNNPFPSITITPAATDIYTVSAVTNTGNINCASVNTIQVTVNPNPTVTAVASRTVMCKDESVILTASGASTYSWSTSASTSSIVVTSSLITTLNYQVIGIGANSCTNAATVSVKVIGCVGLNELNNSLVEVSVYPNPNTGEFTVESHNQINLTVVNQLGQSVKRIVLDANNDYKSKVSGLTAGVYFITGQNSGSSINHKIIVE